MPHRVSVQKPLTAAPRALSVADILLKIVRCPLVKHEPASCFSASNATAVTIPQVTLRFMCSLCRSFSIPSETVVLKSGCDSYWVLEFGVRIS